MQVDEKVAAEAAGVDLRTCTTSEVQAHLDDFNLSREFGTYGRIKGLSGGQKVTLANESPSIYRLALPPIARRFNAPIYVAQ